MILSHHVCRLDACGGQSRWAECDHYVLCVILRACVRAGVRVARAACSESESVRKLQRRWRRFTLTRRLRRHDVLPLIAKSKALTSQQLQNTILDNQEVGMVCVDVRVFPDLWCGAGVHSVPSASL
eukprot:COSAG01_NODE_5903_length_3962_cov_9.509973_9_plen_126_part_00